MKTKQLLITPQIASDILRSNKSNRKIRPYWVAELARQMSGGFWREDTTETIKISASGNLIDGQHRLMALISANVSLNFLVASELDQEIYAFIDQGFKRSAGDVLNDLV